MQNVDVSKWWDHLSNPIVQDVIQEWHTLRTSGAITVPANGTPEGDAMRETMSAFFDAIKALATNHHLALLAEEGPNVFKEIPVDMVNDGIDQAEDMCVKEGFPEAIYALSLLRRRLRDGIKDEQEMIEDMDQVIGLLVPDFRLADVWYHPDTEMQRAQMWTALGEVMKALDAHCPERCSEPITPPQ